MRKYIFLFAFLSFSTLLFGQQKRGMAYGYHSPNDLEILSPEVSWWYNWSEVPESSVANVYSNYNFEFVPMTWNGNFDENKLRTFLSSHPETKYLLAFNEPNFIHQANMTPSKVAEKWPILEAIANDYNLEIVGPAVNFCGDCVSENGTTYYDPFKYLDDFFAACTGCKVDHIAVHSYMNSIGALSWYIGEFKKYNKPIWLTEFAGWEQNGNINNVNDQISFMIGAVDFLESNKDVFRYSWFIGRGSGITTYPYIDLLGADGTLTGLGEIYKQMPVHDENRIIDIPAIIEAESYNIMNGILLEKTSDESGFANVGWIDVGDWLEYKINVPEDNDYDLRFRVATTKSSSLNFFVDGENKLSQNFINTGGWQSWSTFENTISLSKGEHLIRLQAATDGFNINWFQIGNVSTYVNECNFEMENVSIFPNPTQDQIFLELNKPDYYSVRIVDVSGRNHIKTSLNRSGKIELSTLQKGIYFVIVSNESSTLTKKIIVN